jgi:hypothetical protein
MKFASKRDLWLMVLLVGAFLLELILGSAILLTGPDRWVGVVLMLSAGFIAWLLATTDYDIQENILLIRSGPFWWRVPLEGITEITPTHNPLSSPALSLDRLWISYHVGQRKRFIMVSPLQREAFLQAVAAKASHLELSGNQLVMKK